MVTEKMYALKEVEDPRNVALAAEAAAEVFDRVWGGCVAARWRG
jgi:hypothetical protein